jgi:hypothetical protein
MSTVQSIENKFHVTIKPIIDSVDGNNDDVSSNASSGHDSRFRPTTTNPVIDNVDNRSYVPKRYDTKPRQTTTNPVIDNDDNRSRGHDSRPHQTTIKLRSDWSMIAAHPRFKLEYKEFICNYFQKNFFLFKIIY